MTGVAAVGIDDNFSSGKTAVALRASDYKASCRIYKIGSIFVKQLSRDNCLNYIFYYVFSYLLQRYGFIVLRGYDNSVNSDGL